MEKGNSGSGRDASLNRQSESGASIDPRLVQLARETAGLPRKEDLAKNAIKLGCDPRYAAVHYNVDLERCLRYAEALEKQRDEQRDRVAASTGDV